MNFIPSFGHLFSGIVGAAIGAAATALIYKNNIAKVTALLTEVCGHIMAGTSEEEAKIVPKIKVWLAANLHL
jgi:hypothetical protein